MKKLARLWTIGLIILLSLTLVMGCQLPAVPAPDAPSPTPSPTPAPTPTPTPTPEPPPVDEEETTEPLIHSSAYVKFEGIDGESQNEDHEGWSEIVSFSQGIHQPDD